MKTGASAGAGVVMDEDIVISGISGRFPESANMTEFRDNLFNGVNMVTANNRRFKAGIYGIPEGFGALKEIDKFDAEFFHVYPTQASRMDPQLRMSLETTFEAMQDAGVNPLNERESRTGVFFGACSSEAFALWNAQASKVEGPTMTGCAPSMFANRISFEFNFNGPSVCVDTACSTSIVAIEAAVGAMRAGKCDAAIVTASTLILTPHTTINFNKLGMLAPDSVCKSFDSAGNGYVRAESVATIYLQKRSLAKRVYASILHVKTNTDGFKVDGITYPSATVQQELLSEVYDESGIDKNQVAYVESHGTGTAAGDPQEFKSLAHTFASSRSSENPLYLGSVKSNMGHAEAASGLCGIAKLVIALQEGVIPANLHFRSGHYGMKELRNDKVRVVDKHTELPPGLVALNSFGFGGVNTHIVLKPFDKELGTKSSEVVAESTTDGPEIRVITMSGRTEDGIQSALKQVGITNDHHISNLLNEGHKANIHNHNYRGFSIPQIIDGDQLSDFTVVEKSDKFPSGTWFVFNGIGSQWAGMGLGLMRIPTVANSIQSSAQTLSQKFDYDLMSALSSSELPEDPTTCFVCIAAIQIGIVDVLAKVGVRPRGFIGHSAGEMLCAYADGCLTAQETIICAYLRGTSLGSTVGSTHGMAVVQDSWDHVVKTCPPGIYPACHNGEDSVTLSGPKDLLQTYLTAVKKEKRLAKEVNSCGVAFHSPYIEGASKQFHTALQNLVKTPKSRSRAWVSTSVAKENWSSELGKFASPDYFVNNFKSPVLFYDALKEIPANAVVLEIGPSGLLKGLIKKAVSTATVIALQSRDSKNSLLDFVTALGHMYVAQVENLDVNKLYGDPKYPVPLGTPMISPLIKWEHETSWDVPIYGKNGEFLECAFGVDLSRESDSYLSGHQIQGRVLYPAMGYLHLVWTSFAQMHQASPDQFPIVFENVRFNRVTILRTSGKVEFRVNISDLTGHFEIKEGGAAVASGTVRRKLADADEYLIHDYSFAELQEKAAAAGEQEERDRSVDLVESEVYKQLRFSGYEYSGLFKGIMRRDPAGKYYRLDWRKNWISFLDTCLQSALGIFGERSLHTELPTGITKMVICPEQFLGFVENNRPIVKEKGIFTFVDKYMELVRCPGIEISGFQTTPVSAASNKGESTAPVLAPYVFCPYFDNDNRSPNSPLEPVPVCPIIQCVTIIMGNLKSSLVTTIPDIVEFSQSPDQTDTMQISKLIRQDFATPDINYTFYSDNCDPDLVAKYAQVNVKLMGAEALTRDMNRLKETRYDVFILDNDLLLSMALGYIRTGGYILFKLPVGKMSREKMEAKLSLSFTLLVHRTTPTHDVFLARKNMNHDHITTKVVHVSANDLSWVETLKAILLQHEERHLASDEKLSLSLPLIYLVSNGDQESGLLGLTLCLRKEPFGQHIRSILSHENIPLDFNAPGHQLADILKRDLINTVVAADGTLGSFIHVPLPPQTQQQLERKENVFLGIDTVGDLTTLRWTQGFPFQKFPAVEGYVPVKVRVAALNFKDVMLACGNLQPIKRTGLPFVVESSLGHDFAGVNARSGEHVFGFAEGGQALATDVLANSEWLWNMPQGWTFEQAATVPVVYSTVYLALVMKGQIQQGESILIHAGAGGIGLAAIQVALSKNCQIFTTVGSKEKIAFLRKTYPQIPESHIGFSRDSNFELMVRRLTRGRGVDLVLNSLAGEKLEASVRCLAAHGRFLEIGRMDLVADKALGMKLFLKGASYHGINLDGLWNSNPSNRAQLKALIQDELDAGIIQPLPFRTFKPEQVEPAFRYLAGGRQIGKVLITFENQEPSGILAAPQIYFDPRKSYIVIGGLGGVGIELLNWMTSRYAKNLVITTRSGITTAYQAESVKHWKNLAGTTVKVLQLDATDGPSAKTIVEEALKMGPVGGFFNLGLHLDINLMKYQTKEAFAAVMAPKLTLTKHLDQLTRAMCPELDHFVVFSSISSALGFDGNSNYGFASSAMERIIEQRRLDGLPAKAIQWGPIGEVGAWHEEYNAEHDTVNYHGSGVLSIAGALKSLDVLLPHPAPVMLSRRLFELTTPGSGGGAGRAGANEQISIMDHVARILGHAKNQKMNQNAKLTELGMDSVMSMEVKNILEQDFNLTLTAIEIRTLSLKELEDMANNVPANSLTASKPIPQAPSGGLFQLNFIKTMSIGRFTFSECVYPINELAIARMTMNAEGEPKPKAAGSVFVINSLEGPEVLKLLGSLLHLPAYTMQMAKDMPNEGDFGILQKYYFEKMKAVEPEGPYTIVGFSAGVFVGIELSLRLENLGELTKFVLLDMTPGRFHAILDENFGTDRSSMDETDLVITMMSLVFGLDRYSMESVVRKEPTMEKRLEKVTDSLDGIFDERIDAETIKTFLSSKGGVDVFQSYGNYKPSGHLAGKVILVKTTQNLIPYDSTEYWGLEEVCTETPEVHTMDTTHSYIITEPSVRRVAALIN